jgi:tRNA uridine 5-carboxymethylaminomethyl modification enzyme
MEIGHKVGLISEKIVRRLRRKEVLVKDGVNFINRLSLSPKIINPILERNISDPIFENEMLGKLLKRPSIKLSEMAKSESIISTAFFSQLNSSCDGKLYNEVIEQIEIELKYEGYIERQKDEVEKFVRFESLQIPPNISYHKIKSLSAEGREKLIKVQPVSIGQASRINGVTPADISVLMVYLRN